VNFLDDTKLQELHKALQNGETLLMEELWDSPKALIASMAQQATGKHLLILSGKGQEEQKIFHDFGYFSERPVVEFPAWETLPDEDIAPSPDIVGERYKVLERLKEKNEPHIIFSSLQACLQKIIIPDKFSSLYIAPKKGEAFGFEMLILHLEEMGYLRSPVAADKGEFAVRGGIVDIYPVSSPDPFRLEFFGETIESIRTFDPVSQKSLAKADEVEITPAQEMELIANEQKLGTLFDYLGAEAVVIFNDLLALEDRYAQLAGMVQKSTKNFGTLEELLDRAAPLQKIYWTQTPIEELSDVESPGGGFYSDSAPITDVRFEMFGRKLEAGRFRHPFLRVREKLFADSPEEAELLGDAFLQALGRLDLEECRLKILCSSEAEQRTLQKRLLEAEVTLPQQTTFEIGYLSSGFALSRLPFLLLPTAEITHRYKIRRQKLRSTYHSTPSEVFDLTPGELVVHLHNGIGRYLGHEKRRDHNGVMSEFLLIEYAEGGKLYVPMAQSYLISKYIGASETLPKLHTIGSRQWERQRAKTEKAIVGYAQDLLELYAKREVAGGFAYPKEGEESLAFEEEFPFVETEDQLVACRDIKNDMESEKAMDRLVCGDVGYGKTEVAMRAAFKAVVEGGKQVAMLVPTTVLALQHYENFCERFCNFPVNIGLVSRFGKAKKTRETIEGAAKGSVDILIGTHRIIGKDVRFKNLGLVIIDEEHRFGVRAKEHLKKIKTGVDCLTLSATPIPRTLYMSLVGVRNISVINTPPQDRLPIKTVITEPNNEVLKGALLRELARDGQAYFIHNRVESLDEAASRIKKLLPKAGVATVHGQMSAQEVDTVFHAFKNGTIDILVATTIVESGIDIPNANTILIDRSDHFGLADLYQLRGRVGRWNRRAYAYFLVRRPHALPEITRKRLHALAESSGYGGGMKLAMRDLEIRGAGDILGTEQSGHVEAVGFHFYCKMLKRCVERMQGKVSPSLFDVRVDSCYDARLTEEYVNEASLRMELYQRLGEAVTREEVSEIFDELKDRFGPLPEPARWLYHLSRIRIFAMEKDFSLVKIEKKKLTARTKHKGKSIKCEAPLRPAESPQDLEDIVIPTLKRLI